jgi:hypothetical protein
MLKKFSCSLQCGGTTCTLQETAESESSTSPEVSPTASTQSPARSTSGTEDLSPEVLPPVKKGAARSKRKSPPTKKDPTTYPRPAKRAARRPRKAAEAEKAAEEVSPATQLPVQQN